MTIPPIPSLPKGIPCGKNPGYKIARNARKSPKMSAKINFLPHHSPNCPATKWREMDENGGNFFYRH